MNAELYEVVDIVEVPLTDLNLDSLDLNPETTQAFQLKVRYEDRIYPIIIFAESKVEASGDEIIDLWAAYDADEYSEDEIRDILQFALEWFQVLLEEAVKHMIEEASNG